MSEDKRHFIVSAFLIAACSFLSRVLGLFRSTLLSSMFGATSSRGYTDCYTAAFKLPDIIFNIIVFGTISMVLIPYFSAFVKNGDREKFNRACSGFLNFFFLLIGFCIVLGFIFAPAFVKNVLVKGWTDQENIALTIKMTRILLIQVLCMTLSGIFGSYLNTIEKFLAYSLAILSYNLGIIFGIIFFSPFIGIEGVAWGAVLGSFIHLLIQAIGSIANGFRYSFSLPGFSKEIRQLLFVAIPRIVAVSGEQLIRFFITNISSYLIIGSIFIFDNVENFGMAPFGTIAVSISTAVFPIFSKLYIEKDYAGLCNVFFEKIRNMLFLVLPIIVLMIVCRNEIVDLLLTYKNYTPYDAQLTADGLWIYLIGIPFFSVTVILIRFYFDQKKSMIPMIVSFVLVAVTVAGCYVFSGLIAVSGLSLGRSLGYIVQTLLLVVCLYFINKKEKLIQSVPHQFIIEIIKILAVSALILLLGLGLQYLSQPLGSSKPVYLLKCVVFCGSLSVIYFFATLLLKIPESMALSRAIVSRMRKLLKSSR